MTNIKYGTVYYLDIITLQNKNLFGYGCMLKKTGHHHLPPWIRSFDLFRHRRIAIVSWGVHDLFFLEVCS